MSFGINTTLFPPQISNGAIKRVGIKSIVQTQQVWIVLPSLQPHLKIRY